MSTDHAYAQQPVPAPIKGVGIGLRHCHFNDTLSTLPPIDWLEVHSENFFARGSAACALLDDIRSHYPLSAHGVGLSLGSADGLSAPHLQQLKAFIARYEPGLVSEHISWSALGGVHINDLLPLPYTEEALAVVARNISAAQEALGRAIAVENPSSYLQFSHSTMPEWEFMREVALRSGCKLLLDVNNVYVSAHNHGFDPLAYLQALPKHAISEIHLAGYTEEAMDSETVLIDTHSAPVHAPAWALYAEALKLFGDIPTLIEWDSEIPPLERLLEEAGTAKKARQEHLCS